MHVYQAGPKTLAREHETWQAPESVASLAMPSPYRRAVEALLKES